MLWCSFSTKIFWILKLVKTSVRLQLIERFECALWKSYINVWSWKSEINLSNIFIVLNSLHRRDGITVLGWNPNCAAWRHSKSSFMSEKITTFQFQYLCNRIGKTYGHIRLLCSLCAVIKYMQLRRISKWIRIKPNRKANSSKLAGSDKNN